MKYFYIVVITLFYDAVHCVNNNKYSAEANEPKKWTFKELNKPFRVQKINMLWAKAQIRLSEAKLKSLFGELKLHDKEEITWKKLRFEGHDKDGLKEAETRRKFLNILKMYGLIDQANDELEADNYVPPKEFNEASDNRIYKSLFKDKKLNKLWAKAETAGFSAVELEALREEFNHHQDKIDQYYSVLYDTKEGANKEEEQDENSIDDKLNRFNELDTGKVQPRIEVRIKTNLIREKNKEIKDGFDHLYFIAAKGPASKEFVEPKVQGLWKIALETKFAADELQSLKVELLHYENRLLQLRHMQAEHAINEEKYNEKIKFAGEKTHGMQLMEDNIKKQARKVEKIHLDIESRIMQKHLEL